ncbi:MAG: DUF4065 domain-containing protein [Eubacteriales bacterium]|nr:DUF4065 domain-containing protein [Eubacteriales bacterium]
MGQRHKIDFCKECGEEIITIEEIRNLMKLYHIGKAPLSLALGFGEVTVTRYLDGQIPSKRYSDIMRTALHFPEYMQALLQQNRDKVGEIAYQKTQKEIMHLKQLFQISDKMLVVISYVFEQMQEVTPLALQKILYFAQGIYMALYKEELYLEDCVAWERGPVYETVYNLFRDFKYNPIDDYRFVIFSGRSKELMNQERMVLNLVVETFGRYSGKTLEMITRNETPWLETRIKYEKDCVSSVIITKESMKKYFSEAAEEYSLGSLDGLNRYIDRKLGCEER